MAQKVAAATGAWSAAATWNSVTNTPTLHASTNVTIDGTARFTAAFTAPNMTNACTGVLIFVNAVGTGGTVTVTLQESTIDTAAARTINITSLTALTWVYFTFATPYVFTTTGAGAYRFKIQAAAPTGTTNAAADSGGSLYAYLATDDRTGVPGTTDDIWICGLNQATAITVTMDGTQTIGSGTDTVLAVQRTLGNAISLNNLGVLAWDTTADGTLTCKGNIICNNNSGELQMGTVATPMPAARVARLRFDMAVAGNHGLRVFDTGKLTLQGQMAWGTAYKAKYVSGTGVAASPLVVDTAVDWNVGDEIAVSATSDNATNYQETEYRFIITKNSPTSYVLSATSGGAEAAFTYTHNTNAWVLNIQRNVLIDSTNSARGFYILTNSSVDGNIDCDWIRFETIGTGTANKLGFTLSVSSGFIGFGDVDYSVFYRYATGLLTTTTRSILSFTGIIAVNQAAGGTGAGVQTTTNPHNKTFVDCFVFGTLRRGFSFVDTFNLRLTRCYAIACNADNNSVSSGMTFSGVGSVTADDCEIHACRRAGLYMPGAVDVAFNDLLCGTKGINTSIDLDVSAVGIYDTVVFINSSFGSATLVSNYLSMLEGSTVAFHAFNGNSNNHTWYKPNGIARSTGAGLVDTTNKTAGNLTVRIAPETVVPGFVWEFLVGIKANTAASIFGFAQKNVAFGTDVVTIELFLPGSTTADATATLDNTTGAWQVFNLAANYTGSVAAFATVRITAKTVTAAAYVYFTDFYNGTNVLTGLQAWYNGKPTPVMTDLLGDPASVWAILTSTLTTPGTIGALLVDNVDASIADVEADTQDIQATLAANLDAAVSTRATPAQVNAEVVDALATDAYAEPAGVPAATASLAAKIGWLMALARNKILQTATLQSLRNDADSGNIATAAVSDDTVTATRDEWT